MTDGRKLSEAELVRELTSVTRKADELHVKVGGGTRHWVRECFLECLDDAGLAIESKGRVADLERQLALLTVQLEAATADKLEAVRDGSVLRRQLAAAQHDALELKAWRAVAGWAIRNGRVWYDGRWYAIRYGYKDPDASSEFLTDLADAIAPGWRES